MSLLDRTALVFATWFGSGLLPKAPGTWGTLAAIPFVMMLHYLIPGWPYIIAAAAVTLLSIPAAQRALRIYRESSDLAARNPHKEPVFKSKALQGMIKGAEGQAKDPGLIVIDEVAGFAVTMTLLPFSFLAYAGAFFAFRFFDIFKLFPARQLERIGGGAGIVLDDIAAGVYACLASHLGLYVYSLTGLPLF